MVKFACSETNLWRGKRNFSLTGSSVKCRFLYAGSYCNKSHAIISSFVVNSFKTGTLVAKALLPYNNSYLPLHAGTGYSKVGYFN